MWLTGPALSAALQSAAGPMLPAAASRHYLTYYVLSSLRARKHTSLALRAHKGIACKLSETFHHTEQRAGQHHNLVRIFSFSDYVKICKNDI